MLTIRTCASRRNRATKDQPSPFSIAPSILTTMPPIADLRETMRNVAARTSRVADMRVGNHAEPGAMEAERSRIAST